MIDNLREQPQEWGSRGSVLRIALGVSALVAATWILSALLERVLDGVPIQKAIANPSPYASTRGVVMLLLLLALAICLEVLYTQHRSAKQRLGMERAHLAQVYASHREAVLEIGEGYRITHCSSAAEQLAGMPAGALPGTLCYRAIFHRDVPCEECPLVFGFTDSVSVERSIWDPIAGQRRWLWQSFHPVLDGAGRRVSVIETVRDVTLAHESEMALAESHVELQGMVAALTSANEELSDVVECQEQTASALAESEARYRQLVESSPDMVFVHRDGQLLFLNTPGAKLLGLSTAAEAIGMWIADFLSPRDEHMTRDHLMQTLQNGDSASTTALKLRRVDGRELDVEIASGRMSYENQSAIQCVVRDVTEIVSAREEITRLAFHDPLTGLPNRTLFRDRLAAMVARARRRGEALAVLFIDVDELTALGEPVDEGVEQAAMVEIARRFSEILREEDTLARQGSEFGVVARTSDRAAVQALAERLLGSLQSEVSLGSRSTRVQARIGVAVYPEDGLSVSALLRSADIALFEAKSTGPGACCFYDLAMRECLSARLEMEKDLSSALPNGEFELHFQPQVDMRESCCVGVEALLRWRHPERGLLLPQDFLEQAASSGMLGSIDEWVVRSACRTAAGWRDEGVGFGRIAVNLSARSLLAGGIGECIKRALRDTGLEPRLLELEIVETAAIEDTEEVAARLRELADIGVRIAIDDFGTGYSSLSYLRRIPIDTLKIAREFICEIGYATQSEIIATSLVSMCQSLEIDVVAEGVETAEQAEFLQAYGCHVVQGFLVSKPLPHAEVPEFVRAHSVCVAET